MRSRRASALAGAAVLAIFAITAAGTAGAASTDVIVLASGAPHDALFGVALDGTRGVAVGAGGAVLESADGGVSWHAVSPPPQPLSVLGVALNHGHAIAVGQMGSVLRSDTPGVWQKASSGTTERLFAVALNASGAAVAVGSFGTVLRSDDAGASWRPIAPDWSSYSKDGEQPHLYDAAIDAQGVMTIAGEFGLILRSADGKSWQTLHKGDASIFAMDMRGDGGGFAVGQNGTVLRTADGGATWQALDAGSSANFLGVRATGDGHVAVTGMHDMLISGDGGKSWTRPADRRFAASWYQGIADTGPGKPWLVAGNSGALITLTK